MQLRRHSIAEAILNTLVGFVLSNLAWPLVQLYLLHQPYRASQGLLVITAFTVLSVARNYAVRRMFNRTPVDLSAIGEERVFGSVERFPKPTDRNLYWLDAEGDMVCRHCGGSYNFGHFAWCLYDADWRTDRRTKEFIRPTPFPLTP